MFNRRETGSAELVLPDALRLDMLKHLEDAKPGEGCGFFVAEAGEIVEVVPASNVERTSWKYELDPDKMGEALVRQESGEAVGLFHSHPFSPPFPSQIDIACGYVGWLYIIAGLAEDPPLLNAFSVTEEGWQPLRLVATQGKELNE